jgi:hypothetical protein
MYVRRVMTCVKAIHQTLTSILTLIAAVGAIQTAAHAAEEPAWSIKHFGVSRLILRYD